MMLSNILGVFGLFIPYFLTKHPADTIHSLRPSQLAGHNPIELADRLIKAIRESGDLQAAAPNFNSK